ncbi:MAG: hypothetical protein JO332_11405 [Planctomycetaceae bacterium]|nr:hypothetical protein [Planctomycetaceae bacterium]
MKLLIPAILALSAVGCTSSRYMRDADPTPPPGPDEAKVIVYRTAVLGGIDNFPVYAVTADRSQLVGFTETDAYFEYRGAPGKTLFIASGEGDALVEADLQAGETYVLRVWSKFGLVSARPGLAPVEPGSVRWKEFEEARAELQARELAPETREAARRRTEARAEAALAEYRSGLRTAKPLTPAHAAPPESAHGQ